MVRPCKKWGSSAFLSRIALRRAFRLCFLTFDIIELMKIDDVVLTTSFEMFPGVPQGILAFAK